MPQTRDVKKVVLAYSGGLDTSVILHWIRETFAWRFVTSIISPGTDRSIALGLRLGGVLDATLPGIDPGDVVIRHDLRPGGAAPDFARGAHV